MGMITNFLPCDLEQRDEAPPDCLNIDGHSLQRIAYALETMAKNHAELVRERDVYKADFDSMREYALRLERQIRSLKGVITRMRKERDGKD